ncbi:MAG: NYN domain-containing protein [Geitlerinemataceae cyanobacterium]
MSSSSNLAVLLVDGYNAIGRWPELRRVRDRDGYEDARRALTEHLVNYASFQSIETHLVFDAQLRDMRATREQVTSTCFVHFTDMDCTADTYIEKFCARRRQDRTRSDRTIVATSDRAQQLTVIGYGAEWMSVEQLEADVRLTAQRASRKRKPASKRTAKGSLMHRLNPEAQAKLAAMRFGN